MSGDTQNETRRSSTSAFRRPIEWGLIGVTAILLLYAGKALGILPKQLQVPGFAATWGQEEKDLLGSWDQELTTLKAEVAKLRKEVADLADVSDDPKGPTKAEILEPPQDNTTVNKGFLSDQIVKDGQGVIWLGEWNSTYGWTDGTIDSISGQLPPPKQLRGGRVRLMRSVNVRESYPNPNSGYYKSVPIKGVANENTYVSIIDTPRQYYRPTGVQYWSKVVVDYQPKQYESADR